MRGSNEEMKLLFLRPGRLAFIVAPQCGRLPFREDAVEFNHGMFAAEERFIDDCTRGTLTPRHRTGRENWFDHTTS